MKSGPNIAMIASLVGDPARANMLSALMSGRALTASELALEAGVTVQTASSHLSRLVDGGLLLPSKQGRHRYFTLSGSDVAQVLEGLMGIAERTGHTRVRTGPKDPHLRRARVCYDHLAGDAGVAVYDSLVERGLIAVRDTQPELTDRGQVFFSDFGLDLAELARRRRAFCRSCLDWSARRSHLGGAVGAALLDRIYELGWAKREENSRVVRFLPGGESAMRAKFGISGFA